jgi:dethiobiotin synthetase
VANILEHILPTIHLTNAYDFMLVEGAGGLLTPLNSTETYIDLLNNLNYPVILVVGMKLGCLNHAQLTYQCLSQHKLNIAGWIANIIEPEMAYLEENIYYLTHKLPIPLLARVPYKGLLQPTDHLTNLFIK